jgi:hypothetical protein
MADFSLPLASLWQLKKGEEDGMALTVKFIKERLGDFKERERALG